MRAVGGNITHIRLQLILSLSGCAYFISFCSEQVNRAAAAVEHITFRRLVGARMKNTLNIKAARMQYSIFYSWLEQYYSRHQRGGKKNSCWRTPTMLDLKGLKKNNKNIPFRSTTVAMKVMPESMRNKKTQLSMTESFRNVSSAEKGKHLSLFLGLSFVIFNLDSCYSHFPIEKQRAKK